MDNNEKTPLHYAAKNGHVKIVQVLLKADGINVNAVDEDGKTPLDLTTNEEIKTLLKAAEKPDINPVDESSTDNEGDQEEDAGIRQKEKQEGDAQPESDIIKKENSEENSDQSQRKQDISAEQGTGVSNGSQPTGSTQNNGGQTSTTSAGQGTDIKAEGVEPVAPTEPTQTEEQPSSFFGNLFSILMKPFSLIASFFGGFFSWLFRSDEPTQSSSESDQPVVLESPSNSEDNDII